MKDYQLIDFAYNMKNIFGNFKMLDELEIEDFPGFYAFTKIASNYLDMTKIANHEIQ